MLHGYRKVLSYDVRLISKKTETFVYILFYDSNINIIFNKKLEKKWRLNPYGFYTLGFLCNILEITKKSLVENNIVKLILNIFIFGLLFET